MAANKSQQLCMRPNAPSSTGLCPPRSSKPATMEAYWAAWLVAQDRQLAADIKEELEVYKTYIAEEEIQAEIAEQEEVDFQEWWALYRFDDSVRSVCGDERNDDFDSSSADLWGDSGSETSSIF